MLRSMEDAVSGLRMHEQWMDVIGNNIANVNTPGFKASDLTFAQLFAQTLSAGGQPQGAQGGTNPAQVGLGVGLGAITQSQTQGALQQTGNPLDLGLQGSGFFLLDMNGQGTAYTRVGDFGFDAAGNLVERGTGLRVKGWLANAAGVLPTQDATNLQDLVIPRTTIKAPQATSKVAFGGNLDARTAAGQSVTVPFTIYDSLGNAWQLVCTLQPGGTTGQWTWTVTDPSGKANLGGSTSGTVTFTSAGAFSSATGGPFSINPSGAAASTVALDFSALSQYAAASTVALASQDGFAAGTLQSLSVDSSGLITGNFSNGLTQVLGRVAVATFPNPEGLVQQGQGLYVQGNNSGTPQVVVAGTGGTGTIAAGTLEGSNVDLAREFTAMVAAERGFQANARVITVADQMLQSLVQAVQ
jgi:flagellar hook protein FlgE